jgi:hypothetical protein
MKLGKGECTEEVPCFLEMKEGDGGVKERDVSRQRNSPGRDFRVLLRTVLDRQNSVRQGEGPEPSQAYKVGRGKIADGHCISN